MYQEIEQLIGTRFCEKSCCVLMYEVHCIHKEKLHICPCIRDLLAVQLFHRCCTYAHKSQLRDNRSTQSEKLKFPWHFRYIGHRKRGKHLMKLRGVFSTRPPSEGKTFTQP